MSIRELGFPYWNSIVWLIVFIVVMAIAYFLRSKGQKNYQKDTPQARIFLCGEEVPEPEERRVKAHNVYWGFFSTLEDYYNANMKMHTGIVNDFVLWLVAVTAISIIVLVINL